MRELYFFSSYRKSIRTIHFQYGFAGKNSFAGKRFILKITSGEINGRGASEGNTEEVVFEGEQELLKGVYGERRNYLIQRDGKLLKNNQQHNHHLFVMI